MALVNIDDISFERVIYPRKLTEGTDDPYWEYSYKMARDMRAGVHLPAIVLTKLDNKNVLIDGWNRVKAHKQNKRTQIEADFIECKSYDEAYQEAVRRNITHGWRLNDYELAEVARKLQEDFGHSDEEISKIISISPMELQKMKGERWQKTTHGTVVIKRMFVPLRQHQGLPGTITEDQQAMFASRSQLKLIREFKELIKSDLLQTENHKIVEELNEILGILRAMRG